jgi:hypothetical protein
MEDRTMGREDVKQALERIAADQATADRIAAGDLTDVADLDLSADEQTLVTDAAADLPDVAGFASDYLISASKAVKLDQPLTFEGTQKLGPFDKWDAAVKYGFIK